MNIKVIKRNKEVEDYSSEKIAKVVRTAGLGEEETRKLVGIIEEWLRDENLTEVTSLRIRDKVLMEIQKFDRIAAKTFISYEKYKDKNYGVKY